MLQLNDLFWIAKYHSQTQVTDQMNIPVVTTKNALIIAFLVTALIAFSIDLASTDIFASISNATL